MDILEILKVLDGYLALSVAVWMLYDNRKERSDLMSYQRQMYSDDINSARAQINELMDKLLSLCTEEESNAD